MGMRKRKEREESQTWENDPRWNGDTFRYMPKLPADFRSDKKYSRLAACSRSSSWHEQHFNSSWIADSTAGGCRNFIDTFASNPQFLIKLVDSDNDEDELCTCVVSLMQKGSRKKKALSKTGGGALSIGFAIYFLEDPENTQLPLDKDYFRFHLSTASSPSFINYREVVTRLKLKPGSYVIIPSTFEPNEEGDFLLRIFSEKQSESFEVL